MWSKLVFILSFTQNLINPIDMSDHSDGNTIIKIRLFMNSNQNGSTLDVIQILD